MRTVIAIVVLLAGVTASRAQDDVAADLWRIETYEELAPRVRALEANLPEGHAGLKALTAAAAALARFDRVDEATALLLRNRDRLGEEYEADLHLAAADLLEAAGRLDDAIAATRRALEATAGARDPYAGWAPRSRLALRLEQKGDYVVALAEWTASKYRGSCVHDAADPRSLGILRCRFRLGETEEALAGLEGLLVSPDGRSFGGPQGFLLYFELAAETGRADRAKAWLADGPPVLVKRWAPVVEMVTGFEEGDPGRVLEALDGWQRRPDEDRLDFAVRLLAKMGEAATDELEKRIVAGDPLAIRVAEVGRRAELVPALKSRLAIERDRGRRSSLESAIERISR